MNVPEPTMSKRIDENLIESEDEVEAYQRQSSLRSDTNQPPMPPQNTLEKQPKAKEEDLESPHKDSHNHIAPIPKTPILDNKIRLSPYSVTKTPPVSPKMKFSPNNNKIIDEIEES
mmetsp:Transcript_1582/g.1395  ORF Transcript_1582/g.1395 Transcript_1582/m.1395 type:complete len:116 (+) Transcript_1582:37-384(+)